MQFTLENETNIRLTPDQQHLLELQMSRDEVFDAVMTLRSNKTPSLDSITVEFYRKFYKNLIDPLFNMYEYAILQNYVCLQEGGS